MCVIPISETRCYHWEVCAEDSEKWEGKHSQEHISICCWRWPPRIQGQQHPAHLGSGLPTCLVPGLLESFLDHPRPLAMRPLCPSGKDETPPSTLRAVWTWTPLHHDGPGSLDVCMFPKSGSFQAPPAAISFLDPLHLARSRLITAYLP